MASKRDIQWLQGLAAAKGGKCLSTEYKNGHTKYLWECNLGHQWEARPVRYFWCPRCAGQAKQTLQWLTDHASSKNGRCLSTEYINNKTNCRWECGLGHQWEATAHNVIDSDTWCGACEANQKLNIDDLYATGAAKGGKCLSTEYIGTSAKYLWECSLGHQWEATANSVRCDHWCPICAGNTLNDIQWLYDLAKKRDGTCLSIEYTSSRSKYLWKCKDGHQWEARASDIAYKESWCPRCPLKISASHQGILDFVVSLDSTLEVICNDRAKISPLELDIWIPSKNLAIEFCGQYWHGELHNSGVANTRHYDKYKKCLDSGIRLITIFASEWVNKTDIVKMMLLRVMGISTSTKVNARDCVVDVTSEHAITEFLDNNHILGSVAAKHLSLTLDNKLIAVLSYRQDQGGVNIIRYCAKSDVIVRGGFSKLLTRLKNDFPSHTIYTFSDNRWSGGNLYKKTGFRLDGEIRPSYWYYKKGSEQILQHKSRYRKEKILKIFSNEEFSEGATEWQMMQQLGYDRVWDCGLKKWTLV